MNIKFTYFNFVWKYDHFDEILFWYHELLKAWIARVGVCVFVIQSKNVMWKICYTNIMGEILCKHYEVVASLVREV